MLIQVTFDASSRQLRILQCKLAWLEDASDENVPCFAKWILRSRDVFQKWLQAEVQKAVGDSSRPFVAFPDLELLWPNTAGPVLHVRKTCIAWLLGTEDDGFIYLR